MEFVARPVFDFKKTEQTKIAEDGDVADLGDLPRSWRGEES